MEHTFDNSEQLKRVGYRFRSYARLTLLAMRHGVGPLDLFRTRFPFAFREPAKPGSLSIELTDACDLKCPYCSNPGFPNPRTFMSREVTDAICESTRSFRIDRIRVGGGEPTLHPRFSELSAQLSKSAKMFSIVTNGQWRKPGIVEALVANYHLIEISIDAGGAKVYEASRPGSDHARLMANMERLRELRRASRRPPHLNIRLMLRPSTEVFKNEEVRFWSAYADTVMPQYIMKDPETTYAEDMYLPEQAENASFPKCTLPFKDLQVRVNGDVPMCQITGSTKVPGKKLIIGNVLRTPLHELWRGEVLRGIRSAHRHRDEARMEVCRGCRGC